ncbi:aminotransferase class I/II-fold pyridoxal phosphate-dependent enzyme [Motiliproteus sp.]|uniref:aminotransferase class I/II-fold pyridoxal phosphate-dependent enzyme n=1 Tax=Motiliproteus sp. TaxID=1898955 RepID=UPI003BAAFC42
MATSRKPMRDFGLEVFFSRWEFKARHHMTASDLESMKLSELLAMASEEDREGFEQLWLGYTETWGAPDLRFEIAKTYEALEEENILCLAGAGEGIYVVSKCLLTSDDHVIVPTPNYQSAETVPLSVCDVTGVPLLIREGGTDHPEWRLDLDAIKAAIRPNTKLISLNFPHNPTGLLLSTNELKELIELCREHGIYIFSDEVYRGVELDIEQQMPQIADVYEKGISLNVLSKAYGLPGLRIGWIASQDKAVLQKVERYKHFLSICNSAPSEVLGIIALKNRDRILARNRSLMQENVLQLEQLLEDFTGLVEWQRPQGGCVAFPRFIGPGGVEAFCKSLLEDSGVLLLPASIYASELSEVPQDRFRIGFGRDSVFKQGLAAMREHLEVYFPEYSK